MGFKPLRSHPITQTYHIQENRLNHPLIPVYIVLFTIGAITWLTVIKYAMEFLS